MAWAVKYRCEYYDLNGIAWKIDIEEDAFGGAITTLTGSGTPLEFRRDNNSDQYNDPISESQAIFEVFATTDFILADLYSVDEMHFRVQIYQSASLYWIGFIDTGDFSEPYEEVPYPVTIAASCGLKLLKDIRYYDEYLGEDYNGRMYESQIILDILDKIQHTGFTEYVNLYEDRMSQATSDSPMDQLIIDVDIFKDMFCYEVLIHLLTKYNACITQKTGVFVIYRPEELTGATVYGRSFTAVSTHSSTSFAPIQYINRVGHVTTRQQIPGGVVMIQSPAKKVTIKQDYGNKESWLDTWQFKGEDWNEVTDAFEGWTEVGGMHIEPAGGTIRGETDGVVLVTKNTYPTLSAYLSQPFGIYTLVSATDGIIFEFDYLIYNGNSTPVNNFIFYIEVTNGVHYLAISPTDGDAYYWDNSAGTTNIRVEVDGVVPGINDWVHYKRQVVGLPMTGDYEVKLYGTSNAGSYNVMTLAIKNIRFYASSVETVTKPVMITIPMGVRSGILIDPLKPKEIWLRPLIKEFKTVTVNEYVVTNAINGRELEYQYMLGDVVGSGIDNVIEQFQGALAMTVTQSLEQAAGNFVAAFADDYLAGGVILTFDQLSDGDVDIFFTAQAAGVAFTGATSIANVTGDISGTLPAGLQVANISLRARVDKIAINPNIARVDVVEFGPSTGGTGLVTCAGLTKLATFDTDINTTADNFVTAWAASYAVVGVILTNIFNVMFFTADTPGTDFTPATEITFTNASGDLQASAGTNTANVTGSTSGTANITCNGLTKLATFATDAETTAANFVTSWAAAYLASPYFVVVTSIANVIYFTAQTAGTDFTADPTTIANVSGDLNGTATSPYITNIAVAVAQVSVITLLGSSGTANITCDAEVQQIAITTVTDHTISWSTRGGSEIKPILEVIGDEIAAQHARPKQLIQMPIIDKDSAVSAINILGNFQDDLNQFSAVNRTFVHNRSVFDTKNRQWEIDLIEIL